MTRGAIVVILTELPQPSYDAYFSAVFICLYGESKAEQGQENVYILVQ